MDFHLWHLLVIIPTALMYAFWIWMTIHYVRDFHRGYKEAERLHAAGKEIVDDSNNGKEQHDNVTPLFPD